MLLSVRVQPNASRSEVAGFAEGVLGVRVTAPPARGKANRELLALLSRSLGIGQSRINIVRGHTTRNKLIAIEDLSQEEISERLSRARS